MKPRLSLLFWLLVAVVYATGVTWLVNHHGR